MIREAAEGKRKGTKLILGQRAKQENHMRGIKSMLQFQSGLTTFLVSTDEPFWISYTYHQAITRYVNLVTFKLSGGEAYVRECSQLNCFMSIHFHKFSLSSN